MNTFWCKFDVNVMCSLIWGRYIVLTFAILGLALDCATFAAFHVWGRKPEPLPLAQPPRTVASNGRTQKLSGKLARPAGNVDRNEQEEEEERGNSQEKDVSGIVPGVGSQRSSVTHSEMTAGRSSAGEEAAAEDGAAAAAAAGSRLNMCSAFLHVLADCMRSSTTLTEAVLIGWYGFDSERTDAIASLVVSATILLGCAAGAIIWVKSAIRFRSDNAKSSRSRYGSAGRAGDGRDFGFVGHSTSATTSSAGMYSSGSSLRGERKAVGIKLAALPLISVSSVEVGAAGGGSDWQTLPLEGTHGEYLQPERTEGGAARARSPTISSQLSLDSYA